MRLAWVSPLVVALVVTAGGGAADAAKCGGNFDAWMATFKEDAAAAGISKGTIDSALNGVTPSAAILKLDRNQHYFKLTFEQYRAKRVTAGSTAS